MQLGKLCEDIEYTILQGDINTEIIDIRYNSKYVQPGDLFVCIVGSMTDGHNYIDSAVKKGAAAVILENESFCKSVPKEITVIKVASGRAALACISATYFDHPSQKLKTIGITGTKGKTTTAYLIKKILDTAGKKTGLIGTISVIIGNQRTESVNTTPESYELQKIMSDMVDSGCEYLVMEVSSQGVKLNRTDGIIFDYGIFTNLSPDHISPTEHESFDEYLFCKSRLFTHCRTGIVNVDDPYVDKIISGHTCSIVTYSLKQTADYMARQIKFFKKNGILGVDFEIQGKLHHNVRVDLPGEFSVYNALAAISTCNELGIPEDIIWNSITHTQVKGRMEPVHISDNLHVYIDFAHNGISARAALETLKMYGADRITCVFGCGGNRSRERRIGMGKAVGELADMAILTTDNPRYEKVSVINEDIKNAIEKAGGKYIEIDNRKEAIAYAITHAKKDEFIITFGKGHEKYIEIEGVRYYYSEHETIHQIENEIKSGKRHMEYIAM